MAGFRLPPISTLAGSTLGNYIKVMQKGEIDRRYYTMTILTFLIVLVATPFHWWEKLWFAVLARRKKKETKAPLFILGHWRSGTTFLHNVLCQDPEAGYLTTYHGLFPNNLASKLVFKTFMKANMPDKRPADNVALHIDYPQEDDFALGNLGDVSYYNFFYFPRNYERYYGEAINLRLPPKRLKEWQNNYRQLINQALENTAGKRAMIKNPVNTGRVDGLLQVFPNAKFIYIYRNPYTVFLSTRKFFLALCPTLWFQEVSEAYIDDIIFDVFAKIMQDYEDQKMAIASENLMEMRFEEFEKEPLKFLKTIYQDLLDDDFERCEPSMVAFLEAQKNYKKNTYNIERRHLDRINKEWGFYIEAKGYQVPANMNIIESN